MAEFTKSEIEKIRKYYAIFEQIRYAKKFGRAAEGEEDYTAYAVSDLGRRVLNFVIDDGAGSLRKLIGWVPCRPARRWLKEYAYFMRRFPQGFEVGSVAIDVDFESWALRRWCLTEETMRGMDWIASGPGQHWLDQQGAHNDRYFKEVSNGQSK